MKDEILEIGARYHAAILKTLIEIDESSRVEVLAVVIASTLALMLKIKGDAETRKYLLHIASQLGVNDDQGLH